MARGRGTWEVLSFLGKKEKKGGSVEKLGLQEKQKEKTGEVTKEKKKKEKHREKE